MTHVPPLAKVPLRVVPDVPRRRASPFAPARRLSESEVRVLAVRLDERGEVAG